MRIKDIGVTITGKTPSTKESGYFGGTIPFFTPEDIAKGFFLSKPSRTITESGFKSIKSNTLDGLSILVGCIGSDMGNVAVYDGKCATNQQINAITQVRNDINPLYIYYYLSTQKRYLRQIAGTTTTPILPKSTFDEIEIPIPTKRDQDTIVSILSALDRKISHNSHICAELDAMTRTLYDYWFVQFDFPDEHGRPYRTSGGAMEYCPALGRDIPKGWKLLSLNKLASYSTEQVLGSNIPRNCYVGMDNMRPNMQGISMSQYDPPANNTTVFHLADILLGNIRPYFKKIWLSDMDGACSTDVLAIVPNPGISSEYIYASLARDQFFDYVSKGSKGTKMPRGDKDHIMDYPLPFNSNVANEFRIATSSMYQESHRICRESDYLSQLRDWLLPMLINGQTRVEKSITKHTVEKGCNA